MEFLNIGGGEVLALILLAVILFNPEDIMKIMRTIGSYTRRIQQMWSQMSVGIKEELAAEEIEETIAEISEDIKTVKTEVSDVSAEISEDIKDVEGEYKEVSKEIDTDVKSMQQEVSQEVDGVSQDIKKSAFEVKQAIASPEITTGTKIAETDAGASTDAEAEAQRLDAEPSPLVVDTETNVNDESDDQKTETSDQEPQILARDSETQAELADDAIESAGKTDADAAPVTPTLSTNNDEVAGA